MRTRGVEMLWLRRCSSKETLQSSFQRLQMTNRDRAHQKPADMMKMVQSNSSTLTSVYKLTHGIFISNMDDANTCVTGFKISETHVCWIAFIM